jgi:dTDP-4-dehydrorhamnose 3,5-epimerase-like enzyme
LIFRLLRLILCADMDKVLLERLPESKEIDGVKRWGEDKGEFAQICYREEARHIAVFTIKEGFWRGGHYHEKKDEAFYVVEGKIRAVFVDLDTEERMEHFLKKGDRLRVKPRCWHVFYGIGDSLVVQYSPQVYDATDAYQRKIDDWR